MKYSRRFIFKFIRLICKSESIQLVIKRSVQNWGQYIISEQKIVLYLDSEYKRRNILIHMFFHEYCHHLCYKRNLLRRYHRNKKQYLMHPRFFFFALDAERKVNKMARQMYLPLFPGIKKSYICL